MDNEQLEYEVATLVDRLNTVEQTAYNTVARIGDIDNAIYRITSTDRDATVDIVEQRLTALEESVEHILQLLENIKTSLTWEACVLNGVQEKNTQTSIER